MAERCIILLGIGHTNAHVVREWVKAPLPNCRLVCVSRFPKATYSGMLPGTLAGQFNPEEMGIDLNRLVMAAGAKMILDEVTGVRTAISEAIAILKLGTNSTRPTTKSSVNRRNVPEFVCRNSHPRRSLPGVSDEPNQSCFYADKMIRELSCESAGSGTFSTKESCND